MILEEAIRDTQVSRENERSKYMLRSHCRVAVVLGAIVMSGVVSVAVAHADPAADGAQYGYPADMAVAEPQLGSEWVRCTAADVCFTFIGGARVGLSGNGFAVPNVRLDDVANVEAGVYFAGCQQMDITGRPMQPLVLIPHAKVAIPAGTVLRTCWQEPA